MAPLAELTHHNFPNSLPEFVPANHIEAYGQLRSAFKYLSHQFSYPLLSRADAVRMGQFSHYHVWYLDRLDVLKRATANLRKKLKEAGDITKQEELFS